MTLQTWTVTVDGATRTITADEDPQSNRTTVRVDGRMALRPFESTQSETTFSVGPVVYVLRRHSDGVLELDVAPESAARAIGPPKYALPERKQKNGFEWGKLIVAALLSIALAGGVRWVKDAARYWSVPWKVYTHPDATFQVAFPGTPRQESIAVGGQSMVLLHAEYGRHYYAASFYDLPAAVDESDVVKCDAVLDAALKGAMSRSGSTLLHKSSHYVRMHPALSFQARTTAGEGHPEGSMNGTMALCGGRLVMVLAVAPQREILYRDIGEFLRSFTLPDPDLVRAPTRR